MTDDGSTAGVDGASTRYDARRLLGSAGVTVEACDGARASPLRGRKQLWAVPQRCWQA